MPAAFATAENGIEFRQGIERAGFRHLRNGHGSRLNGLDHATREALQRRLPVPSDVNLPPTPLMPMSFAPSCKHLGGSALIVDDVTFLAGKKQRPREASAQTAPARRRRYRSPPGKTETSWSKTPFSQHRLRTTRMAVDAIGGLGSVVRGERASRTWRLAPTTLSLAKFMGAIHWRERLGGDVRRRARAAPHVFRSQCVQRSVDQKPVRTVYLAGAPPSFPFVARPLPACLNNLARKPVLATLCGLSEIWQCPITLGQLCCPNWQSGHGPRLGRAALTKTGMNTNCGRCTGLWPSGT